MARDLRDTYGWDKQDLADKLTKQVIDAALQQRGHITADDDEAASLHNHVNGGMPSEAANRGKTDGVERRPK